MLDKNKKLKAIGLDRNRHRCSLKIPVPKSENFKE